MTQLEPEFAKGHFSLTDDRSILTVVSCVVSCERFQEQSPAFEATPQSFARLEQRAQ